MLEEMLADISNHLPREVVRTSMRPNKFSKMFCEPLPLYGHPCLRTHPICVL